MKKFSVIATFQNRSEFTRGLFLLTIVLIISLGSCETMNKLLAGEPLISGNITQQKNTREGALIPNEGAFIPEWLQGDWESEDTPGVLAYTITPNEVRYLGRVGLLGTYRDKLMEDKGYTLEYFIKTNEEATYELEAGADNQYVSFIRATKDEDGVILFISGMNDGAESKYIRSAQ